MATLFYSKARTSKSIKYLIERPAFIIHINREHLILKFGKVIAFLELDNFSNSYEELDKMKEQNIHIHFNNKPKERSVRRLRHTSRSKGLKAYLG